MGKNLLKLILGTGLTFLGANVYSQSNNDEIPEPVRLKVSEYTQNISYCSDVKIKLAFENMEKDRNGDGIKDKVLVYNVEGCDVIPNYFIFTYYGLKEGGFSNQGKSETKTLRDNAWKTIPLKEENL